MRRRQAFTIVELLVSLALIIFIMVVMTEAFSAGLGTFRQLKAVGDMQERLRATSTVLRRDLAADHFEGRRRLSDPDILTLPVREGFFRIVQGVFPDGPPNVKSSLSDGQDPDLSTLAPVMATNHRLHFTIKLRGNNKKDYFAASIPSGSPLDPINSPATTFGGLTGDGRDGRFQNVNMVYHSAWAEVGYFLERAQGDPVAGATPLYTLFRVQRVLLPENTWANSQNTTVTHEDFSTVPLSSPLAFNTPMTVARHNPNPIPATATFQTAYNARALDPMNPSVAGATPLLTDVISFNVRVMRRFSSSNADSYFTDLYTTTTQPPQPPTPWPANPPVGFLYPWSWDTADLNYRSARANPGTDPLPPGYKETQPDPQFTLDAIQISLRIWDARTEQTRQITIIQDL